MPLVTLHRETWNYFLCICANRQHRTVPGRWHSILCLEAELVYTLLGALVAFDSRQALLETLGRKWPDRLAPLMPSVSLTLSHGQVFENQARDYLDEFPTDLASADADSAASHQGRCKQRP
ncbi:hypothetical protein EXN22_10470 [Pseudomonas tructae]|uniref:Uncharacterized protein n=1 Tax=Pseudomonas tructae TaxID=2518644 RepID=A0A411MH16_9PSED|nr:hypothetical protein [Pseudomonas tructae]QBF26101.1 hypothetical protein EXN22_10470 [Pseudomonas tructae]